MKIIVNENLELLGGGMLQLINDHKDDDENVNANFLFNIHVSYSIFQIDYCEFFKIITYLCDKNYIEIYNDGSNFIVKMLIDTY
jgi:hypothetical protein